MANCLFMLCLARATIINMNWQLCSSIMTSILLRMRKKGRVHMSARANIKDGLEDSTAASVALTPILTWWRRFGPVCSFRQECLDSHVTLCWHEWQDSHFVRTGILHGVGRSTKNFETCIVLYLSSTIWSSKQSKTNFDNNKIGKNSKNEQKLLLF